MTLLVRYVLTACIRDKVFLSMIVASAVAVSLSVFLGSTAIVEQDQFVIVFAASSLRFLLIMGITLFIVFYTRRTVEQRDLDYLITRPITRRDYIVAHTASFAIISLLLSSVIFTVIGLIGKGYFNAGYILWGISLFFEMVIVASAAFFFSMVLRSAVSAVLSTFALYALARLIGQIIGIAVSPDIAAQYPFFANTMTTVSLFVPRLDLFAQSSWLLYGTDKFGFLSILVFVQGVIFTTLLTVMTLIDLHKKEF